MPTKETLEKVRKVQELKANGSTMTAAFEEAGISPSSYHNAKHFLGPKVVVSKARKSYTRKPSVTAAKPERAMLFIGTTAELLEVARHFRGN